MTEELTRSIHQHHVILVNHFANRAQQTLGMINVKHLKTVVVAHQP